MARPCPICAIDDPELLATFESQLAMGLSESDLWNLLSAAGHKVSLNNIKTHRKHSRNLESSLQPKAIARISSSALTEPALSLDEQQTRLLQDALEHTQILSEMFKDQPNIKTARSLAEAYQVTNRLIEARMRRQQLPDPVINVTFPRISLEAKMVADGHMSLETYEEVMGHPYRP